MFTTKAYTMGQFLEQVRAVKTHFQQLGPNHLGEEVWYRGVSSHIHKLIPGAHRETYANYDEHTALDRFRATANGHQDLGKCPSNEWEWYFLMQHYGLPTRLLDWTENPLIALFFAVSTERKRRRSCLDCGIDKKDLRLDTPAVWMMDAGSLNLTTAGADRILSIAGPLEHALQSWLPSICSPQQVRPIAYVGSNCTITCTNEVPLALFPVRANPRISAQSGMFTIHGSGKIPIEDILATSKSAEHRRIARIDIDANATDAIYEDLEDIGILSHVLFPELSELASFIRHICAFAPDPKV